MKSGTKSSNPGKRISRPEITHISARGIWLLFGDNEYFLNFKDFPWFQRATVEQIHRVEHHGRGHFHWPDLDVDLDLDRIREPGKFPLVSKG